MLQTIISGNYFNFEIYSITQDIGCLDIARCHFSKNQPNPNLKYEPNQIKRREAL